jgi:glutathione S-transferase
VYTLYGQVKSRAMRPLWLLEELEVPFEFEPVLPRSPEARALSPAGRIPILRADGAILTDSVAMMTFLADRHGAFTEAPGTVARAQQDAATNTLLETFDAVLWAYAKHSFTLPEAQRVPEVKPSLRWQFARQADAMAERLGDGPFLLGAEMRLPDILLAHCCGWAAGLTFDLPSRLRAHMTRMRARPAFRRAIAHG